MSPPTLSHQIAAVLRDEILTGQYREGERLPSERELALRFEAHRGAVREALKQLEQLGVAEIRPGGARVAPLDAANLDIISHLMALDSPPSPVLIEQVLEAFRAVVAVAVRLSVERASESDLETLAEQIEALASTALSREALLRLEVGLSDQFIDLSQNLVLRLIRRSLAARIAELIEVRGLRVRPPREEITRRAKELCVAVRTREAATAATLMEDGMAMIHGLILGQLRTEAPRDSPRAPVANRS